MVKRRAGTSLGSSNFFLATELSMSLSDKYYEGLSAPLPVAGAQMPTDLVPYAGNPLDALEQHLQKYRQIDYANRISEQTSKRLLRQLAEAEAKYEEEAMDKISFIGSNPISRRAYYLEKIADNTSIVAPPPGPATGQPAQQAATTPQGIPPTADPSVTPTEPLSEAERASIDRANRELGLPSIEGTHQEAADATRAIGRMDRPRGYVGPNALELGNSGRTLDTIDRFSRAYKGQEPPTPLATKEPPAKQDTRGIYDRITDGLYHYGTRAARGLSTGAQMGASYLYDKAQENELLAPKSFLGDALDYAGYRSDLAQQMARINAGLAHSYGRDERDPNSKLYADRVRRIDVDPAKAGIQSREDLLSQSRFKEQILKDQMSRYEGRDLPKEELDRLRESASRVFDNYYGFTGNQAGTPRIREDLDGSSFRQGIVELGDSLSQAFRRAQAQTDAADIVSPAKASIRSGELLRLMEKYPEVRSQLEEIYGTEAAQANMSLEDYAAKRLATDFTIDPAESEANSNLEERESRYTTSRDAVGEIMESMPQEERVSFLQKLNPQAIQEANALSALVDSDPEEAMRAINSMDPRRAKYVLDFIKTVEPLVSRVGALPESRIDPAKFEVPEDRDDLLPSLGGVDIVNPALQEVGGGANLSEMTGNARKRVYGFNGMHDLPASKGRYYLVDDGYFVNTYYNPITRDIVRAPFTDFGNLSSAVRNSEQGSYSTNNPLPARYHDAYTKQTGLRPSYRGEN